MVDPAPRLLPAYSGDVVLPSLLRTSVQGAQPLVQRDLPTQPGLLSCGARGSILNRSLPNPAWIAPEDLQKPFKASKLVEDGLTFYRAQHAQSGVPTGLQRDLLEEACSPDELQATAKLKGNRVACTDVNGARLIAHPVGQAGERLCLSVLTESSDGGFQGSSQSHAQASGAPVLQLSWNQPQRSDDKLLLACRTSHWICVYEASPYEAQQAAQSGRSLDVPRAGRGEDSWMLKPVAAHQAAVRISHVAWNRQLPSLVGYVCEDGSLHMADSASQAGTDGFRCIWDVQMGPARQTSLDGDDFPLMQPHAVGRAGRPTGPRKHARLVCEWGLHPTTLLLAAGAQLLRFDIRKPGIICAPRVIHRLPEGDAFVALAPLHQRSSAAQAQQRQHLLAASTLDCVMLMDLRRPGQALLKWPHGNQREPPQLLSMVSVPGPKGGTPDTEARFTHRPPHPQRTPAESTLSKAAAPEQGGPVGTPDPDVLALQYGSSSQLPGSQAEPGQATPARLLSLFGTQASRATPPRPHRSVLQPAEAPGSWPVSWQPEATKQRNAQGLPDQADSQSGILVSKGIQGRICAASMGSGDVLLYSLICSEHETNVHAWPPAVRQAGATSDGNNSAVGGIKAVPIMTGRPNVGARHGRTADGQPQPGSVPSRGQSGKKGPQQQSEAPAPVISDEAGFTWSPAGMTGTFAPGLARRVCWPLKALDRVDGGLEGLAPDLAQQLEEVHREGPDLCGMAVMPAAASSGDSESILFRLGFLGHVSVEKFCDPVDPPIDKGAHAQAAIAWNAATYNMFEASRASEDLRVLNEQRQRPPPQTERDLVCSMSGHRAIAQAVLQASAEEPDAAAEATLGMQQALQSLMQDMKVPLSLWEISQELGSTAAAAAAAPSQDGLQVYRRRMGSALEGAPVIDYTTPGSRASRLQRWDKLRTDAGNLAELRYHQALSDARDGGQTAFSAAWRLRSLVAGIASAQEPSAGGAVKLGESISMPVRTSLASAQHAQRSAGVPTGSGVGSQRATQTTTLSQASPPVGSSSKQHAPVDRFTGTGDIVFPLSRMEPMQAADDGSQGAQLLLNLKTPQVEDEAAKKALKELERDWEEFAGQMTGQPKSRAPALPHIDYGRSPGQAGRHAGHKRAQAAELPAPQPKGKRSAGALTSQGKAKKSATQTRASIMSQEGFS